MIIKKGKDEIQRIREEIWIVILDKEDVQFLLDELQYPRITTRDGFWEDLREGLALRTCGMCGGASFELCDEHSDAVLATEEKEEEWG